MKITDKAVLKLLSRANSPALSAHLKAYPDDALEEDMTEYSVFVDELEYLIWLYEGEGNVFYDDLKIARNILKETENGKSIPILDDFTFKYYPEDIQEAKDTVNEYRRLKKLLQECLS